MKNVIFGSGIVGLAAKKLLAGQWDIVPFGRSRFYSFNPPLADNFISRDETIDRAVADLVAGSPGLGGPALATSGLRIYGRAYSALGQLVAGHDEALCRAWLTKVFGDDVPGQALPYFRTRMATPIYGARASELYMSLQREYLAYLQREAALGPITEIGPHYFIRGGVRTDFDNAISTIPLPALLDLAGLRHELRSKREYYVLVRSSRVDLEGHNQALVVDSAIDFYRVTNVAPGLFMFYFLSDVGSPGAYLMPIIGAADIIDGTAIADAIPIGSSSADLDSYGIYCIGSNAQHDWCADVGSNIFRLVKYAQRDYKP